MAKRQQSRVVAQSEIGPTTYVEGGDIVQHTSTDPAVVDRERREAMDEAGVTQEGQQATGTARTAAPATDDTPAPAAAAPARKGSSRKSAAAKSGSSKKSTATGKAKR